MPAGAPRAEVTPGPVRTCVGCRQRCSSAELLRVVEGNGHHAGHLVPDARQRMPGRGAWVHPDPECLDRAEQRRAFARALRLGQPQDSTLVREWVTQFGSTGSGR